MGMTDSDEELSKVLGDLGWGHSDSQTHLVLQSLREPWG